MWEALCHLLNLPELASLNENDRSARVAHIDPLLRGAIRQWHYTALYNALEEKGIAFGPVMPIDQVLSNPQITARAMVQPWSGQSYVVQPVLFNGQNFAIQRGVPDLGEQTRQLLGD